ncbi:MAG: winged helix-turn-helix domain-containing protein [Candidatus Nitrosocaldus sp.]|nr:winged helix-turn-helix domain-containing protein [Candidatus Nitrosocaldus sp.]MDW8275080.1 winged helix-turn-helix domain-containing protein [Candidatus Nitrosocaldus sp.]
MSVATHETKRDKLDILLRIVEVTATPAKKTHILYKANLNFYQLNRYIDELINLGFIKEMEVPFKGYVATEKGKQFLTMMRNNIRP